MPLLDFMSVAGTAPTSPPSRRQTNTDAPDFAKAHPDQFLPESAEKVAAITVNVHYKFAEGGTWQNRWPTHVDVDEAEWARL